MLPTCLAIVNNSTASPLSASVTPQWLDGLATALAEQCQSHIAPEWGMGADVGVRVSDGTDIAAGEWVIVLVDSGPPDALGWHDEEGNDVPTGYADVSLESSLDDLSLTCSHEFAEMLLNAFINLWVESLNGAQYARELCDAVESNRYQASNGYTLSDFVTQSFFDPMGAAPYSYMQSLPGADPSGPWPPGPFQTAPGGYQNIRGAAAMQPVIGVGVTPPTGPRGKRAFEGTHTPLDRSYRLDARKYLARDHVLRTSQVATQPAPAPDGT